MKVLWKANSSRHDWRDGGPLRGVLAAATELGLIAGSSDELAAALIDTISESAELTISGELPAPWEIYRSIQQFDRESGMVDGMNTLWFTFDRSRVRGRAASDALANAFIAAHSPENAEYAFIHPYDHFFDFSQARYDDPVTINVSFRGILWANFLGPGHIEDFDLALLRDLPAHSVQWVDGNGLFVIATPALDSADTAESETVMEQLTERFRAALRRTSRWRQ